MSGDGLENAPQSPVELLGLIARDTERLVDQHVELLRSEFRQGLHEIPPAIASMATGAGLVATGGMLTSLMLVHALHRATRLPLWGCYGVIGGLMGTVGIGLLGAGAQRAAHIRLVPRETLAALREDAQWIKNQVNRPPTS